jgi:hypothetical protein
MFVNTPSSVKWSDMISEELATESPWIYGELLASKLIRNKSRKVHRDLLHKSFSEHADSCRNAFEVLDNFYRQIGMDLERGIIND